MRNDAAMHFHSAFSKNRLSFSLPLVSEALDLLH